MDTSELLARFEGVHSDAVGKAGRLDDVDPGLAKVIVRAGKKDGDASDDKVSISKATWVATTLKPSQSTMILEKALGMAMGMLESGKIGGDLGAIVSDDNYIMDGHHRWAATIFASGRAGKVGGFKADISGAKLQPVLNLLTKGQFKIARGKKGKGFLSRFTASNAKDVLDGFVSDGIPGDYPKSPEEVKAILTKNFGSPEGGVKAMAGNAKLIEKSTPAWAPSRDQMPVIEPEQVSVASHKLKSGEVDHASPYAESEGPTDKDLLEARSMHTNIKSAVTEGHKLAAMTGVPHYCYGESGKYKISKEKPEAELRYIQITPGGNEWTWSYNPSAEKWTKSRLGMVSESTGGPEWDRVLQLSGIVEG